MPAPRKITDAQRNRILRVWRIRQRLPSDKDLARQFGITVNGLRSVIRQFMVVSVETNPAMIQQDGRTRPDRI